jgi:hypothetical protein
MVCAPGRDRSILAPGRRLGVLLTRLCFLGAASLLAPVVLAQCPDLHDPAAFSDGSFRVRSIQIRSPIDFFHAVSKSLDLIKPELPLKEGAVFSASLYSQGTAAIQLALSNGLGSSTRRVKIIVVIGRISSCHVQGALKQVDITYWAVTNDYNAYIAHSLEAAAAEIRAPSTTAARINSDGSFFVEPRMEYNRSLDLFGGSLATIKTSAGPFDTITFDGGASSSSRLADLELSGAKSPGKTWLDYAQWRLGYKYSDVPAGDARLKQGKLFAQFFAATEPLAGSAIVLRYGAAIDGGNEQSNLSAAAAGAGNMPSTSYGSVKLYAGITAGVGRNSFAASYGLQLGSVRPAVEVDYAKHVFDISYIGRVLLPQPKAATYHRPLTFEARGAGGIIQSSGDLPVPERFFGGSALQPFIAGDTWSIQSAPFIRSIPENTLNGGASIGGTSFFSTNLTVSTPVWGRALVPKEVASDPDFAPALNSTLASAQQTLADVYETDSPAFKAAMAALPQLQSALQQLEDELETYRKKAAPPANVDAEIASVEHTDQFAMQLAANVAKQKGVGLKSLVKGNFSQVTRLTKDLGDLESLAPAPETDRIKTLQNSIESLQSAIVNDLAEVDVNKAEARATRDLSAAKPMLNAFLHELNLIAISPVVIFDAARLWPDPEGMRYGVGGGIRVTVVTLNLTLGYAVNPNPRFQEGRGALFFSMKVANLFH